jgi:hypothetical protein
MTEQRTGGCECGSYRYQITGAPKTIVICHCRDCQRQSGSAFGSSMVVADAQFTELSGALACFERAAFSGATMRGYFCPLCGTRIFHAKPGAPGLKILKAGTLDDTATIKPLAQLWTSRKQIWLDFPDVPAFARQPE